MYGSFFLLIVGVFAYGSNSPTSSADPLVDLYRLGVYFLLDVLIVTRSWRWSRMYIWFQLQRRKELRQHYDHKRSDGR